jgi:hypothetical protein
MHKYNIDRLAMDKMMNRRKSMIFPGDFETFARLSMIKNFSNCSHSKSKHKQKRLILIFKFFAKETKN